MLVIRSTAFSFGLILLVSFGYGQVSEKGYVFF